MPESKTPFYTQTAVLDAYIKADAASLAPETVEFIAATLRTKPDLYTYFFRRRPDSSWAKELSTRGYFENAPELVARDGGWSVPRWEEQEYLISISQEAPTVAVEHAKRIKGHGYYHERAITALKSIPPEMIEEVVPLILNWLDDKNLAPFISTEVLSLVKILAVAGAGASAFQLFEKVTVPQPSGDTRTIEEYSFNSRAVPLFSFDDYDERTIESASATLQKLDAKKTISVLETQLCEALRIEAEATGEKDYKSRTFWRIAVEDSDQDILNYYKDKLLSVLRDTLDATVRDDSQDLTALVEKYLSDEHAIFRRVGFYILSQFPEKLKEQVVQEILKLENTEDVEIHHEYFALLKNGFSQLGSSEREQFFNAVLVGPSQEKLDHLYHLDEEETEAERREYADRYSKSWVRDRLWMLRDYLSAEQNEILNSFVKELGKPERPDYTHWTSGAYFISDVSPLPVEDLRAKSNQELLDFLKKWKPAPENFGPERESYGALGHQLANLILSDIERYQPIAKEIASLHADFATPLIDMSLPENFDFDAVTELRLDICEHLLNFEHVRTSLEELPNGSWVSLRFVTAKMFKKFLTDEKIKLLESQWLRVKDLLVKLADDPDPDLERDRPKEGWFGSNDPLTVAINHVRSEAISALIIYAQKVLVEKIKDEGAKTKRNIDPVVKEVLTEKVRRKNDFSLAVHSVFGGYLDRLYWMDEEWVRENLDEIFPVGDDEESVIFYVAAWDSYVILVHSIYRELFDKLRPRYRRAIDNMSQGYLTKTHLNPVRGLAQHLLLDYELNKYHPASAEGRESLIVEFFNKAQPEYRGQAVWELNQRTHQNKDNWQLAKDFWQWRLEVAANANHSSDFEPEMEGFSQLLLAAPETENVKTLWSLLEGFLPYIEDSEKRDRIWYNLQKFLAREVERDPVEAIRFYGLMHDRLSRPRFYYEEEATKIFRLGVTDKNSRQDTIQLADKLYRRGSHEFQNIIESGLAQIE